MNDLNANAEVPTPSPGPVNPTSLGSRMFNVFAAPGEVFDEVRASPPRASNWIWPTVFAIVVGWVCGWLIMADPVLQQQMRDLQETALQKQAKKMNLSEQDLEARRAATEKFGTIMKTVGVYGGPVIVAPVLLLWWAFLFWLLGTKVFHANFTFGKAVEASGLAGLVGLLQGIVVTLLILVMGSVFAGPNLALPFARNFEQTNILHVALSKIDVVDLWLLAVRSIALTRLSGVSFGKAAGWVFGISFGLTALVAAAALTVSRVFGG